MSVSISYASGIYTLESKQILKGSIEAIWDFFSRPENLNKITPDDLKFKITTPNLPEKTYAGQIISYEIEIFPMVKNYWVTEISQVVDRQLFVDEQRFGPYAMWHHEHHFVQQAPNEILMIDRISYKLPFGLIGRWIAGGLIEKKLKKIFTYRFETCEQLFNK